MKKGFIFDVDGVIADTPHEAAWRDSLEHLFREEENWKRILHKTSYDPRNFSTDLYRKQISGKPRIEGARSVLKYFHVPDPDGKLLSSYCDFKQEVFLNKIEQGEFTVYDDAILFLLEAKRKGGMIAAASSSKNANQILEQINLYEIAMKNNIKYDFITMQTNLLNLFDGNVCGIDVGEGKPGPDIFIKAANSIRLLSDDCLVVEDAVNGVQAAKAGKFFCIGIARLDNMAELEEAHADIVTNDLSKIYSNIFG